MGRHPELESLLNDWVGVLGDLVDAACRASIKTVYDHGGREAVQTFVRNAAQHEAVAVHYVDSNTDFHAIMRQDQRYWFCNDLEAERGYRNTSPDYNYRSTIVWPLLLTHRAEDEAGHLVHRDAIVGFLCVDSEAPDTFDQSRDVALGFSFIDVLSLIIDRAYDLGKLEVGHPAADG